MHSRKLILGDYQFWVVLSRNDTKLGMCEMTHVSFMNFMKNTCARWHTYSCLPVGYKAKDAQIAQWIPTILQVFILEPSLLNWICSKESSKFTKITSLNFTVFRWETYDFLLRFFSKLHWLLRGFSRKEAFHPAYFNYAQERNKSSISNVKEALPKSIKFTSSAFETNVAFNILERNVNYLRIGI